MRVAMAVLFEFTAAVLLALTTLVTGNHFSECQTFQDSSYPWKCGGAPRIIPGSSTVQWRNYYPNIINQTYLEVRKVNDVWSQTGCLNSEEVIHSRSFYGTSASTIRYQFPSMDYDSLYIAKVFWIDRSSNAYYRNNSECYFIPQRTPPPIPSVNIESSGITARSVTIDLNNCTGLDSSFGTVKYVARYSSPGGQELMAETTAVKLQIKDLSAATVYTFTVTCNNTAGQSGTSVSVTATTKTEDTLQPNVSSVAVSSSLHFVDISWNPPSAVDLVSGYDVQVVPHVGGIPQSPSVYLMATSSRYSRSYRVMQSLMPETVYTFQVRARTTVGASQWSIPVATSTLPAVPKTVDGFSLQSSLSTTISMSWNGSNATVDYYMLTIHSMEANATEHYQLFHTVNSHTFHNLSSNTAYSVTITAVNKAGSGPTVSLNVTTQGSDDAVQPLAVTTGIFGTVIFIGVVGVLLAGGVWFGGRHVIPKLRALSRRKDDDCQIEENVAYATAPGDRLWSQNFFFHKKEGVGSEEDQWGSEGGGQGIPELDYAPNIPSRVYLEEKEKGPTEFASVPVYIDEESFHEESGWFEPAPADVITGKLGMDLAVFADLGPGVYFMHHKTKKQAKWVGLSPDLCRTLCGLFFQLYQKERSELSPLEVELKFFSPFATDWDIQVWVADPKELVMEKAKKIVECKTLKPLGLNTSLTFTDKETWEEFTSWFQAKKRKQK